MSPTAVSVKAIADYRIYVIFDNGEERIYDVKPLIQGEWFGELQDKEYFNTVRIAGLSVEWEHGQDVCPDDLYKNSVAV